MAVIPATIEAMYVQRWRDLVFALSVLIGLGAVGLAQVQRRSLEAHIADIIGPVSVDCWVPGTATVSWDPLQAGFACAQEAVKQHKAFQQVEHGFSEDAATARGLIGTVDGTTFVVWYDSAPCGGPGCPERFEATPCPLPRVRMSHAVEFTCRPGS
jgi:hypothetical protein